MENYLVILIDWEWQIQESDLRPNIISASVAHIDRVYAELTRF